MRLAVVLCFSAACGGNDVTVQTDAAKPGDAPVTARCDPNAPFKTPTLVSALNGPTEDLGARFSPDELTVIFSRTTSNAWDLWTASRAKATDMFGTPTIVGPANSIYNDLWPTLSTDGLSLELNSDRITQNVYRVWRTTRTSLTAAWGPPELVDSLQDGDEHPYSPNASSIYFASATRTTVGKNDIFRGTVDTTGKVSAITAVIGGVNTPNIEVVPVVSADELHIYFAENDGVNGYDIFEASRSSTSDGFGAAAGVPGMSAPAVDELPSWISPDNCHFYFSSNVGVSGTDLYLATRE